MGYYTALHVDCTLRPEHAAAVEFVMSRDRRPLRARGVPAWLQLYSERPEYAFLEKFARDERCDFIPFGGCGYMPDGWRDAVPGPPPEWDNKVFFDPASRRWAFACTLKNYDDTIGLFLTEALPALVESVLVCRKQTEDGAETPYNFVAGAFAAGATVFRGDRDVHPWG